jgi:hypothetical protein
MLVSAETRIKMIRDNRVASSENKKGLVVLLPIRGENMITLNQKSEIVILNLSPPFPIIISLK